MKTRTIGRSLLAFAAALLTFNGRARASRQQHDSAAPVVMAPANPLGRRAVNPRYRTTHQGARECARRVRQLEAGQIHG